jgi:hypothetical protein
MGIRCAAHATPSIRKKLALTSPTSGGRSIGIVRSGTKATDFSFRSVINYTKPQTAQHSLSHFTYSQWCAVRTATGYGLNSQGVRVRVRVEARFLSSRCPDRFWGPPSPLHGYQGHFPRGYNGRGMKLTTHLQLLQRSRIRGSTHLLHQVPSWHSA